MLIASRQPGPFVERVATAVPAAVADALISAPSLADAPSPGGGRTLELWEGLATLAAADLGVARALEPHLDAQAILRQAREAGSADGAAALGGTWGVFAAEGGPTKLRAELGANGWALDGVKPWCSLAGALDAALITAWIDDERRALFAVRLADADGVEVEQGGWHARGLTDIPSGSVRFAAAPAIQVGEPGWYLERPGFAWGGIGVAACWFGGAVGLARTLHAALTSRTTSALHEMHLGAVDEVISAARLALADASRAVDAGEATGSDGGLLAKRVRGIVARAVEETIARVGHALGPAPLATDADHARRVADLTLYIRQHHAEADQASLGRQLLQVDRPW